MTNRSPRSQTSTFAWCLIAAGCICLALGILGVGFQAAGFGLTGQSIAAIIVGFIAALIGCMVMSETDTPAPRLAQVRRPAQQSPPPVSVHQNAWNTPTPERVYVASWRTDERALPPGRSA